VNAVGPDLRQRVLELAQGRYARVNDQHVTELLAEREGIHLSRSTVRRILRTAGLPSPRKRRAPKHRQRRERAPQEGLLVQIDGSPHDWLEGRGPRLTLLLAVDDATGKVLAALFRPQEDAHGYFLVLRRIVQTLGRPVALYHDRHSIFERSPKASETLEEQLTGKREPTQFGRLVAELGIRSIPARSPQAKGRVERCGGTFQDRLVVELRLAGACTLAEANHVLEAFLPHFNARFAVPAAAADLAYRPLDPGVDPETLFCFKYLRTVAADNTVRLGEHRLQLLPSRERASYARARVEVQERLDGSVAVYYQGRCVATKPAPPEAPVLRARPGRAQAKAAAPKPRNPSSAAGQAVAVGSVEMWADQRAVHLSTPRPRPDHPWRNAYKQHGDRIAEPLR